jgi:hypothetical protein
MGGDTTSSRKRSQALTAMNYADIVLIAENVVWR